MQALTSNHKAGSGRKDTAKPHRRLKELVSAFCNERSMWPDASEIELLASKAVGSAHCSGNDGYEEDHNLMIELIDAVSLHSSLLNTKGAWTQRGLWIHSLHHLILATAIASMQLEA